ncbi:MAG: hypothetical protein LBS43_03270 [Prevotellaceae bacterium]|jgi:hypothetical protein|nr:hypothetical protein [Prevotellaceae bacterium]
MKIKSILFILMLSIALVMLNSCKKNKGEDNTPIEEKIEQAYQEIKATADAILLSDDPNFYTLAQECEKREEVKKAEATDDGLMIEFTNGMIRGWLKTQNDSENPDYHAQQIRSAVKKSAQSTQQNTTAGTANAKICIVNAVYNNEDPFFYQCRDSVTNIANLFASKGWDVDIKNGEEASVMFYKNEMNNYDAIYNITHGTLGLDNTWIITGESLRNSNSDGYVTANRQMAVIAMDEMRDGKEVVISYWALSGQFFSANYADKNFPNTFIYLVACHGLEYPEQFAKIFVDNGAKVVVGWDNSNCLGVYTGNVLLANILNNNTTLVNTINKLPINKTYDVCHNANLTYYPASAGDYCFFDEISSYSFADGVVTLEKNIDYTDYRTNADGAKFYKTTLALEVETDGIKQRSKIETGDNLYTNLSKGMNPCMLIDIDKKTISVFANSKMQGNNYSMDGFVYRINANSKTWQKETVFTEANFGWHSFFGGSDNGNPELWHFSYAGYYAMFSKRTEQGTWATQNKGSINPNLADRQYYSHKNILISSSAGVDYMSFQDDSSYDNLTGFSNNPSTLISGITVVKDILGNN